MYFEVSFLSFLVTEDQNVEFRMCFVYLVKDVF